MSKPGYFICFRPWEFMRCGEILKELGVAALWSREVSYQLSLLWWQSRGLHRLVHWVGAAEGVVEAVDLLEALVALFIDAFALRHLVEDRGLWLRVVFHKLHVLKDWRKEIDSIRKHVLFILRKGPTLRKNSYYYSLALFQSVSFVSSSSPQPVTAAGCPTIGLFLLEVPSC